jgi:putative spermidine/putrescine transport system substrate-binding protein
MFKNHRWIIVVLGLVLVFGGSLAACKPAATPTPVSPTKAPPTPVPPTATPVPEVKELVVQTWGGAIQEAENAAFYEPFEKETGIKVIQVVGGGDTGAKLKAMVEAGKVEWDVVTGYGLRDIMRMVNDGLLEKVDYSIVTNTGDLIPGGKHEYAVAMEIYGDVIAYDVDAFKDNPPTSPADFFDLEKFPGNRTVNNWGGPDMPCYFALLADGMSRDQIWTTLQTKEGVDRCFKKLDTIKPVLRTFESGDQMMRLFLDKEVTMGIVLDGRMNKVNSLGGNVKIMWDGGLLDPAYWAVVKNAPHKDTGMKFLNYILTPERQAVYTQHIFYATSNTKASQYLPEDLRRNASTYPDNMAKLHVFTSDESILLGKILPGLIEDWNAWLSK